MYVTLVKANGDANYEPYLQIYEPGTGNRVVSLRGGTTAEFAGLSSFTASQSGTYSVVVRDYTGPYAGSYRVLILRVPAAQAVQQFEPDAVGPLVSGLPLVSSNAPSGDLDLISFSATNGELVYMTLVKVGGDPNYQPHLQVFQPGTGGGLLSGGLNGGTAAEFGAVATFTAGQSGTYSVVVRDNTGPYTGSYRVLILRVPAAQPVQQFEPDPVGPLVSGLPLVSTNAPSGDLDLISLNATNGELVYVTLAKVSGDANYQPRLQIFEPMTGAAMLSAALTGGTAVESAAESSFTAGQSGTYSVVVRDNTGPYTGSYRVLILRVPAAQPVQQFEPDPVGPLVSGLPLVSTNAPSGDLDLISLNATNGELVYVTLAKVSGDANYQPRLQIFEPMTGAAVLSAALTGGTAAESAAVSSFTAGQSGTYSVVVRDNTGPYTGSYRVLILRVPAAQPVQQFEPDPVGPLVSGLPLVSSNAPSGDLDLISFSATNGEYVYMSLVKTGGDANYQPRLVVFEPTTAATVLPSGLNAGSTVELGAWTAFTAGQSGTYSVVVRDLNGPYTGSYRVLMLRVPAAQPVQQFEPDAVGPLVSGVPLLATNAPSGDLDLVSFVNTNGQSVYVSLVKVGGDTSYEPSLAAFEPGTGTLIFFLRAGTLNGGGASGTFSAGRTGAYSMILHDYNGGGRTGAYQLTAIGPPQIVVQPVSQVVTQGSTVTLSVQAAGAAAFNYQWQKNGINIVGATNAALILTNVQPTSIGNYRVIVSDVAGSTTTVNASLTVTLCNYVAATITFSEFASGSSLSNQYVPWGLVFSGSNGGPQIADDADDPDTPVLSGLPLFQQSSGSITARFVQPDNPSVPAVATNVSFDAGETDDTASTAVSWFDTNSVLLGSVTNTRYGNVRVTIPGAIGGFTIAIVGSTPSGYSIDNLSFATKVASAAAAPPPAATSGFGLTIITHGYYSGTGDWVQAMANSINCRMGGGVPIHTLKIIRSGVNGAVLSAPLPEVADVATRGAGILLIDWSDAATGACFETTPPVPTWVIGDLVASFLGQNDILLKLPIHLIGHSRGGSVNSRLAKNLAASGIWVEQMTTLDPRPLPSPLGCIGPNADFEVQAWDNVLFADNYFQGSTVGGIPVAGTYELDLSSIVTGDGYDCSFSPQYWFDPSYRNGIAHTQIHTYYHGTISIWCPTEPTPLCVDNILIQSAWYESPNPGGWRRQTGFYYTRSGGGDRYGVEAASGLHYRLTGAVQNNRQPTTLVGSGWPNATFKPLASYNRPANTPIDLTYFYQDAGSSMDIVFALDNDSNPFNDSAGVCYRQIGSRSNNPPSSSISGQATFSWTPANSDAGTWYVQIKATDGAGHVRYDYLPSPINVTATGQAQSDLVLQNLTVTPTTLESGSAATVAFTIRNVGLGIAYPSSANIRLNSSSTGVTINDTPLVIGVNTPGLAPSETFPVTLSVTIPQVGTAGTYYVWVIVDVNNEANQSDTSDVSDKAKVPMTITVPPAPTAVGDSVQVYGTGTSGLRLRSPNPCDAPVVGANHFDGAQGRIIGGPQICPINGVSYTFWKIQWADCALGWSAQDWLKKISSTTISCSERITLSNPASGNGTFQFTVSGAVGGTYVILASSNLVNWFPLSTNTIPGGGLVTISDPAAKNYAKRFYRATSFAATQFPSPPRLGPVTLLPGRLVQIGLLGVPGQAYIIQVSTNLVNWTALTNLTLTNGFGQFTDPSPANYNRRFYRAATP